MVMFCFEPNDFDDSNSKVDSQLVRLVRQAEQNRSLIFCCSMIPHFECHEFCVHSFIGDKTAFSQDDPMVPTYSVR